MRPCAVAYDLPMAVFALKYASNLQAVVRQTVPVLFMGASQQDCEGSGFRGILLPRGMLLDGNVC